MSATGVAIDLSGTGSDTDPTGGAEVLLDTLDPDRSEEQDGQTPEVDAHALFEDVWPIRLKNASIDDIVGRVETFFQARGITRESVWFRTNGARWVLTYLDAFPGEDWQAKWDASPLSKAALADCPPLIAPDLPRGRRDRLIGGITALFTFDVIRPAPHLVMGRFSNQLWGMIPLARDDAHANLLDTFPIGSPQSREHARGLLGRLLLLTGKPIAALTGEDLLAYRAVILRAKGSANGVEHLWSALASQETGKVTGSFRDAIRTGQMTVAQLVDRYSVRSKRVRNFLIAYLTRRQAGGIDYSTLRGLTFAVVRQFWCIVEQIEPGIDSLNLSDDTAEAWRKEAKLRRVGDEIRERQSWPDTYFNVRAMYLDVQQWAHDEPEKWAEWACRSPISDEHLRGYRKIKKRRTSRMHQRTRERAPVAARLADAAEGILAETLELVAAAKAVQPDDEFTLRGQRYRRIDDGTEGRHLLVRQLTGAVPFSWDKVRTGRKPKSASRMDMRDLTTEEEYAFWAFCVIETLRHTGVRVEEMLELTQMDLIDYKHRDGTVILLHVNPSKTDQERILVVPPELAAVFAQMMRRIREASGSTSQALPSVAAYDELERESLRPMPMLFQRTAGRGVKGQTAPMARRTVRDLIHATCIRAGITGPDGEVLRFTPHDFRRIFATDSLSSGMPPHIIAKLLGHDSLATTQQYMAIYPQDVIDAHRSFISTRRALPERREEYRPVTDQEWDEFSEHFGKRQIAIGDCMRAYGTKCSHEYACEQCSLARPSEKARPRLTAIVTSLDEQMDEATQRGWQGEVERLTYIRQAVLEKIEDLDRAARRSQLVSLPMPTVRPAGVP